MQCVYGEAGPRASPVSPQADGAGNNGLYDALDLLLMHRFATVTALQLFPSAEATHVWQNILPVSAHTEPLLMHGILALAGMDLARMDSDARSTYRTRAFHHQQMGLSIFQDMLQGDSAAQIHTVFPFSLMLVILAFASAHSEAAEPSVDAILDLFALFRGPRALATANYTAIAESEYYVLLRPNDTKPPPGLSDEVVRQAEKLRAIGSDDIARLATKQLAEAIEVSAQRFDLRVIGRWPAMLSEHFFARLKQHHPEALIVLSHYSIVLAAFRDRWWVGPWDRMLLSAVSRALPESEQTRLDWRMEQLESVLDRHAGVSDQVESKT
ncbi:hypothetical protein B0A55_05716 [Friedmanniomyces simplex]|uniref:Transcription factor domain-containing protein n=1 Tax=Friedmanniomyces simplex TaxID=329884 RepID=A0A4U0XAB5_9PEZI|nr:hypothetical protein B0A55_05716 [Friedmanniomyces simplex]